MLFKDFTGHEVIVTRKVNIRKGTTADGVVFASVADLISWLTIDDSLSGPKGATARLMKILGEMNEKEAQNKTV